MFNRITALLLALALTVAGVVISAPSVPVAHASGPFTLELQPDAAAGQDVFLLLAAPTTNFGTWASFPVGNTSNEFVTGRALIKFNLSALPANAEVVTATLSLYETADNATNTRTFRVYRQLRPWAEAEATWNIYATCAPWSSPGGFAACDSEQVEIGARAMLAAETVGEFKDFDLTPTTKAGLDAGFGWIIKADGEELDQHAFASSDATDAGTRPRLTIVYTIPNTPTTTPTSTATPTNTPAPTVTPAPTSEDNVDISFVAAGAVVGGTAANITLVAPTISAGDYLLAAIFKRSGSDPGIPAGWSLRKQQVAGTIDLYAYEKIADGSESGAGFTWTHLSAIRSGVIVAYRGVHQSSPMDATATSATNGAPHSSANIVSVHDKSWHILIWAVGVTTTSAWNTPAGYSQRVASGSANGLTIDDKSITPAGAAGSQSKTYTGTQTASQSISIALRDVDSPDPVFFAGASVQQHAMPRSNIIPASGAAVVRR